MSFELTPFQRPAYERLLKQRRHGVAYEMGLGKTVVAVRALYDLVQAHKIEKVLILCPRNAIGVWEDHINDWFEGLDEQTGRATRTPFVIHRWRKKQHHAEGRRALWQLSTSSLASPILDVYITTYEGFIRYVGHFHPPDVVILDEAKRIRSRKSKAFEALKPLLRNRDLYFWPMTGTPGKTPGDFFTMFHLMDHRYFSSYWKFVGAFSYTQALPWGGIEILGFKNEHQWHTLLKTKFSFLSKKQVGKLPVRRQLLKIEMDQVQRSHYQPLVDEMMVVTDDKIILASTTLVQTLRLRQLLVCPKLLDRALPSYGAAIEDLIDTIEDCDPNVAIFCPFTEAFPFFRERLRLAGYPDVPTLQGGITPEEQAAAIKSFRTSRGPILCSILYAQAFSLEPASRGFFVGYDFDTESNRQAEGRLDRLTTTYPVNIYYYAYEDTYDARMCEIVNVKQQMINRTMPLDKIGVKF